MQNILKRLDLLDSYTGIDTGSWLRCDVSGLNHHSPIYDVFKRAVIEANKQIRIGSPLEENILMGPLVDHKVIENMQVALKR
jgi:acyl-CoA reductase-like NAD-dependent aldehyde dehydrogenase